MGRREQQLASCYVSPEEETNQEIKGSQAGCQRTPYRYAQSCAKPGMPGRSLSARASYRQIG